MPKDTLPTLNEGNEPPLDDSLSDLAPVTRVSAPWHLSADRIDPKPAVAPKVQVPGYEILGELGRGGMGVVYKARQTGLNRLVALKMILSGVHASADDLKRFRTEAEAIARLHHPFIVQVFDIGEFEGRPFFSLEFCNGGSLEHALRQRPLVPREAARLVEQLAQAMQAAHERGIIHRDLKPANVLLQGEVHEPAAHAADATATLHTSLVPKITDFGLAKKLDEAGQTASGAIMGTPSYMAPEQACGDTRMFGPHTDVYALGAILYQCLTGRPPFHAATAMETLMQVLHGEPLPPSDLQPSVPRDLETICLKCLQKMPHRRYQSAAALADDLRRFREGEPIQARPAGRAERVIKWVRRRPTFAALLGVSFLTVVAGFVAGVIFTDSLQQQRDAARTARDEAEIALNTARVEKQNAETARKNEAEEHERAKKAQRERTLAQVKALFDATPQAVPTLLDALAPFRAEIAPTLQEVLTEPEPPRKDAVAHARWLQNQTRANLVVLANDTKSRSFLRERLLAPELPPDEMLLLRTQLAPYSAAMKDDLWAALERPETSAATRFRVLVALAAFDPNNPRWQQVAGLLVEPLLASNSLHVGIWSEALRPIKDHLYEPLRRAFTGSVREGDRLVAASLLQNYEATNPEHLAELIADADPQQFALLLPTVRDQGEATAKYLNEELLGWWLLTVLPDSVQDARARRQANAAAALLHLGRSEATWKLLAQTSPPEARSYLIQRLAPLQVAPSLLIGRLNGEMNPAVRRGLILALGEYSEANLPLELRKPLVATLLRWYVDDPDAGVHSAIDWLLRHSHEGPVPRVLDWGQAAALAALDRELEGKPLPKGQGWFVNKEGMTFAVFPGVTEFVMGSPLEEPGRGRFEVQHTRRINRTFAVGTREVTVAQWERFLKEHPEVTHVYNKEFSPSPDGPIITVTWFEAVAFCSWLSEKEKIPENQRCYPPVADVLAAAKDPKKPLKIPADFLTRTGYRLPTEAEWEAACRAGTSTSRPAGNADALLDRYGWYLNNAQDQAWPCGMKRPNEAGLFDMLGNAYEWCQELSLNYPKTPGSLTVPDEQVGPEVSSVMMRALRGGTLGVRASKLRSAMRDEQAANVRFRTFGFRVVRTMPER